VPSITGWWRLEGRARRADMEEGLRAAVADPLWMLGRQEQLGAFGGEDAATPVGVALDGRVGRLSRYADGLPGAGTPVAYSSTRLPLETLVEREPPPHTSGQDLRTAAEAGLRLLEMLRAAGFAAYATGYRNEFRLRRPAGPLDEETSRLLNVVAERVPDGHALRAAFRPPGTPAGAVVLPARPPIDSTDATNVRNLVLAWLRWYDALFSQAAQQQPAWVPDRMEYAFSVGARGRPATGGPDETVLVAREYAGGHLDWYSFDVSPGATLGAAADPEPQSVSRRVLAIPASFGGMPAARWFEVENARINFGRVSAGPPDLARLLLVEYAALYGNDHFLVPITLDVGSLCRVDSIVVVDNFGGRARVVPSEQAGVGDWRMFRLAVDGAAGAASAPILFLPPALGPILEGSPVEEVALIRDEMTNVAWGIERIVEGPSGSRLDRFEAYQEELRRDERAAPTEAPRPDAPLRYRVQTDVPPHWFPLVPVQAGRRQVRLQLRTMLDDAGRPVLPLGRFLRGMNAARLELYEEELPRAGVRLTRSYHHARWIDGSTHVWLGRAKRTGRGEGSSGLRFDVLERET
jgi:hypothetical protein